MDVTSFIWWHRITLRHTAREKDRKRKGAETRKSDELKMERGPNKRPDGLSETVAVRSMKRGRGGGGGWGGRAVGREGGRQGDAARQKERSPSSYPLQTVEAGRGERKSKRGKGRLCEVGREGRWGKCGRGRRVCAHMNRSSPSACVPLGSVSFGQRIEKLRQSLSQLQRLPPQ